MIAAGINTKALSTYMGHSTITITLDRYGHLLPGNEHTSRPPPRHLAHTRHSNLTVRRKHARPGERGRGVVG